MGASLATIGTVPVCGTCGMDTITGCYNICPNSPNHYSVEQERADEPWYGMDDHHERYAAERADLAHEDDWSIEEQEAWCDFLSGEDIPPAAIGPDDIPF